MKGRRDDTPTLTTTSTFLGTMTDSGYTRSIKMMKSNHRDQELRAAKRLAGVESVVLTILLRMRRC